MRSSLRRPDAPLRIDTCALRQPKCAATSATTSALARPSTGGDFSRASQVPSGCCSRQLRRALGFTLNSMNFATRPIMPHRPYPPRADSLESEASLTTQKVATSWRANWYC